MIRKRRKWMKLPELLARVDACLPSSGYLCKVWVLWDCWNFQPQLVDPQRSHQQQLQQPQHQACHHHTQPWTHPLHLSLTFQPVGGTLWEPHQGQAWASAPCHQSLLLCRREASGCSRRPGREDQKSPTGTLFSQSSPPVAHGSCWWFSGSETPPSSPPHLPFFSFSFFWRKTIWWKKVWIDVWEQCCEFRWLLIQRAVLLGSIYGIHESGCDQLMMLIGLEDW